ncbi:MAG: hypothetical protein AAGB03_11365 [Pseudomonadota bacterium]
MPELLRQLCLDEGEIVFNEGRLRAKHPELKRLDGVGFSGVGALIDFVLEQPIAFEGNEPGYAKLVRKRRGAGAIVVLDTTPRQGCYHIRSAYLLDKKNIEALHKAIPWRCKK